MIKKAANYLFYIALSIEILIVILDKSAYIIKNDGQLFRLTFALFLLKLVLTKYSPKEWLIIGAFSVLGIISYFNTGRNEILRLVIMIAACKEMNHDSVLKFMLYTTSLGCMVLVILSFLGVGTLSITTDFGRGVITRYCFGLGHPNAFHCMFWALITLGLYVYRDTIKWCYLVLLFLANIGLYIYTDSRAGVIATAFSITVFVLLRVQIIQRMKKTIMICIGAELLISFIISALLMNLNLYVTIFKPYDQQLITGRALWTHLLVKQAEVNFWLPFSTVNHSGQTDLGIVKMVYWYGYIPTVIFGLLAFWLVKTALLNDDYASAMVVASIVLYSVFEGHDISVYHGRNYLYFLWGKYWTKMFNCNSCEEKYLWSYFQEGI